MVTFLLVFKVEVKNKVLKSSHRQLSLYCSYFNNSPENSARVSFKLI